MAQKTAKELGEETREIAMTISREVAGVIVKESDINRNRFKVRYEGHLPPEVAEIARENGFAFRECFGQRAVFERQE